MIDPATLINGKLTEQAVGSPLASGSIRAAWLIQTPDGNEYVSQVLISDVSLLNDYIRKIKSGK